jgi:hypothetical protein
LIRNNRAPNFKHRNRAGELLLQRQHEIIKRVKANIYTHKRGEELTIPTMSLLKKTQKRSEKKGETERKRRGW